MVCVFLLSVTGRTSQDSARPPCPIWGPASADRSEGPKKNDKNNIGKTNYKKKLDIQRRHVLICENSLNDISISKNVATTVGCCMFSLIFFQTLEGVFSSSAWVFSISFIFSRIRRSEKKFKKKSLI